MPYAEVNGIRMYYEEWGQGTPVLLLHGGMSAIDDPWGGWVALMPMLSWSHRLIAIEHRGHGRTDNPAGLLSYAQIAGDVAVFLGQRADGPVHVAGMSDGGIAGLHLAMHHPEHVRSLVGVGVNYVIDDRVAAANAGPDAEVIERDTPGLASIWSRSHGRNKTPDWWKTLLRQERDMVAVSPTYTEADLGRVQAPALFIAGENDPYGNLDQMAGLKRHVQGAEIMIVNDAGHPVHATHPQIVGPAIVDFIRRAERSGAPDSR